jgi:hypothetical protein
MTKFATLTFRPAEAALLDIARCVIISSCALALVLANQALPL